MVCPWNSPRDAKDSVTNIKIESLKWDGQRTLRSTEMRGAPIQKSEK